MMPQLSMMRRRKSKIIFVNQATTLVNVKGGKLVERRKNEPVLVLPPLLVRRKKQSYQCMKITVLFLGPTHFLQLGNLAIF